jgi:hypothetical protein
MGTILTELRDIGGAWKPIDSYPPEMLGVTGFSDPSLSADGLRMVAYGMIAGAYGPIYTSRPSLDVRFDAFQILTTLPSQARDPFITEDCARIYFSALSTVFYVEQE